MSNNGNKQNTESAKLHLPEVTLCAVSSVNVNATIAALARCDAKITFSHIVLLTDADASILPDVKFSLELIKIAPLRSSKAYSEFILNTLVDYITTPYCMIVQWDGHPVQTELWDPKFLECDYIGASWPQFSDGRDVGNGGFSLRSRRLMALCKSPEFEKVHPEDMAIGRTNRSWLEIHGMRFATRSMADQFSAERSSNTRHTFGYHGVFNMASALGHDELWRTYLQLDEFGSVDHDFWVLVRSVLKGPHGLRRATRMIIDRIKRAQRQAFVGSHADV